MPKYHNRWDTKRIIHKHAPQWGTDNQGTTVLVVLPDKHYKGGHTEQRSHSIHKPDTKLAEDDYEVFPND